MQQFSVLDSGHNPGSTFAFLQMSTYDFIVVHNFLWKLFFFYSAYTFDWNVLPINKLRTTHIYTTLHWNDSSVEETVPLACVGLNVVTRCQVLGHSCLWPQHHNTGQSHWWLLVPAPCWEHPTISWCSAVRLLIEQFEAVYYLSHVYPPEA